MPTPRPRAIILFDADCSFCEASISFVRRRDRTRQFDFVPLRSAKARALLDPLGMNGERLQTVVLLDSGEAYLRSEAALRIVSSFGGAWRLVGALRAIPLRWRNRAYDWVARHRHRFLRSPTMCTTKR